MKKSLLTALTTIVLVASLGFSGASAATQKIGVKVDGKAITFPDAQPYIDPSNSRTMVPVRFVSESLSSNVAWDNNTRTVLINNKGEKTITLKVGEKRAFVNGKPVTFDARAVIKDNRTFVPLRFVSEAFGAKVDWKANENLVLISTNTQSVVKDVTGLDFPVNEKDPTFQAFHKSLTIKNGILTGKVPNTNLDINFSVYFKEGHTPIADVLEAGESFSYKVEDIKAMGITIIDRAKKEELAGYAYRSLPDLYVESTNRGD